MKTRFIIIRITLLCYAVCLLCQPSLFAGLPTDREVTEWSKALYANQTNSSGGLLIPFLDAKSQSNVVVTISDYFGNGRPCPAKYTNVISNTNLFTPEQQKLLIEIPLQYKNVTTNSGPPGTVLVNLVKTNYITPIVNIKNDLCVAWFQHTNTGLRDKVSFFAPQKVSVDFQTRSGDEYVLNTDQRNGSLLAFWQVKRGVSNGVFAEFDYPIEDDHVSSYRLFTNGMVIGKYFMWGPHGNLIIEADFKTPYDFERHRINIK